MTAVKYLGTTMNIKALAPCDIILLYGELWLARYNGLFGSLQVDQTNQISLASKDKGPWTSSPWACRERTAAGACSSRSAGAH